MAWFFHSVVMPVLVIGVLVFIHEFGHFLLAKWCGVGVVRFSVGFGPALFRFRRRETEYQVGIIPLGGFVRMVGDMPDMLTGPQATDGEVRDGDGEEVEEPEEISEELKAVIEDRNRWFIEKNFWQRSAIVVAGPLFNYFLAIALVFFAVLFFGEERSSETSRIGTVMKKSPAYTAGLRVDDVVTAIDGKVVSTWTQLRNTVREGEGNVISVDIERDGVAQTLSITPQLKEVRTYTGEKQKAYFIGISPKFERVYGGFWRAAEFGVLWTVDKTMLTYIGLWGMLSGKVSPKDLAGPLFILDAAGDQSKEGFDNLLYFTALLSVSLAVLNLLPIPILDGGHLLFFIIEALVGPISIRKKEFAQQVGMLLLICLMVFALHNDISRDTDSMKKRIEWEDGEEKGASSSDASAVNEAPSGNAEGAVTK